MFWYLLLLYPKLRKRTNRNRGDTWFIAHVHTMWGTFCHCEMRAEVVLNAEICMYTSHPTNYSPNLILLRPGLEHEPFHINHQFSTLNYLDNYTISRWIEVHKSIPITSKSCNVKKIQTWHSVLYRCAMVHNS